MRVRKLLEKKGSKVFSVGKDTTVYEALKIMAKKEIGVILVVEDKKLVGIFSERDYARKIILNGKSSEDTLISEVMTEDVVTASPNDKVGKCLSKMTKKHFRHLPVVEGKKVVGLISISDIRSLT